MDKEFNMEIPYILAPIAGYIVAGSLKFALNTWRSRQLAFSHIGLGGMPSTHNTITSSTFFTVVFVEGFYSSVSAVAFSVSIIVAIDSMDLRRKLETHALLISAELSKVSTKAKNMRLKLGHTPMEVIVAWVLGMGIGYTLSIII